MKKYLEVETVEECDDSWISEVSTGPTSICAVTVDDAIAVDAEVDKQIALMKFSAEISTEQNQQLYQLFRKYSTVLPSTSRKLGQCS